MRNVAYRIVQADVIIFLDVPLRVCLYRIFKRALFGFGNIRDTSAPECPERFPDREFLTYVWNFNRKHKPVIQQLLQQYEAHDGLKTIVSREITPKLSILRSNFGGQTCEALCEVRSATANKDNFILKLLFPHN